MREDADERRIDHGHGTCLGGREDAEADADQDEERDGEGEAGALEGLPELGPGNALLTCRPVVAIAGDEGGGDHEGHAQKEPRDDAADEEPADRDIGQEPVDDGPMPGGRMGVMIAEQAVMAATKAGE